MLKRIFYRSIFTFLLIFSSSVTAEMPEFVHCFDFGCKSNQEIKFSNAQWQQIITLFADRSIDMASEKQAIRQAIATMETFSGQIAGTHLDKAGNYPGYEIERQQDCIDESTNTFGYLSALEELGLLKWHSVDLKQRRIVWFFSHWTAVIAEHQSGQRFAVDSWYQDNGELPFLQPIGDWERKLDFPVTYNPELVRL